MHSVRWWTFWGFGVGLSGGWAVIALAAALRSPFAFESIARIALLFAPVFAVLCGLIAMAVRRVRLRGQPTVAPKPEPTPEPVTYMTVVK